MNNRIAGIAETTVKVLSLAAAGIVICLYSHFTLTRFGVDLEIRLVLAGLLGGAGIGLLCAILFAGRALAASATAALLSGASIWGLKSIKVLHVTYRFSAMGLNPKLPPRPAPSVELQWVAPIIALCLLVGGLVGYAVFTRLLEKRVPLREKLQPAVGFVCALALASYVFSNVMRAGMRAESELAVIGLAPFACGLLAGFSCGALIRKWSYAIGIVVALLVSVGSMLVWRALWSIAEPQGQAVPGYLLGFAYPIAVALITSAGAVVGRLVWQSIATRGRECP